MNKKIFPSLLIIIFLLTGCNAAGQLGSSKKTAVYEYTTIERGTIEKTVSSTGTLEPVATVKVLPQMSGKVEKIYVDYNDVVTRGQILAELNTDMLKLQRQQQASQVLKARANYNLQLVNFQNLQKLIEKNLISEYEFNSGRTSLEIQRAELSVAESNLASIETEINQYAYITSPIDGTVLERTITEGDTVVDSSSSNSSAIFTLAENLEEMRIESWVGELDIASIYEGQEVRFTLESLPGKNFTGMVESKRLMPSVQDNVVSYNIIISVENKDGSLLPGMTCSVEFIEEKRENVLLVPNAALRYQPTTLSAVEISDMVFNASLEGMSDDEKKAALEQREQARQKQESSESAQPAAPAASGGLSSLMQGGGRTSLRGVRQQSRTAGSTQSRTGGQAPLRQLWFTDDETNALSCITVQTGLSDGSYTEIIPLQNSSLDILEGKRIILRESVQ